MLLQAPTLYDILIYSCIQHMDSPFACGAGDLSIGSRDWAARPALISAYLQELCKGVCKPCSGSGWVAIIFPGILVVGKVLAGCIGFAPYVQVATRVMSSMLYLNAQGCKIFETNIRGCLKSMQLPCFNSCGKMIFVVLRYSSRSA